MLSSYLIDKIFQKLRFPFPIVTMAQDTTSNKTISSQMVPGPSKTVIWKLKNWMQYSTLLVQRARCVMEVGGGVGDDDSPKTILRFKLKEWSDIDHRYRDGTSFKITNIYYGLYVKILNDDINENPVTFEVRGHDDLNELDTEEVPITVSDNKYVCIDSFLIYVRRQEEGPQGLVAVEPLQNGITVLHEDTEELNIKITVKMFKVKEEIEEDSASSGEVMGPASVLQNGQKLDEFGEYLEEANFCDVKLKMSDEALLPAHRIILSSRSSVFKAMLTSDMKESKEQVIGIPDIGSEAMKIILRHIYTGEVEFNLSEENDGELMKQVVYGANKYNLPRLLQYCDKVAIKVVNFVNAWELLKLAKMHNMPRAMEDLEKFVQKNCLDILETMGANQQI